MEEAYRDRTQRCALSIGNARLDYSFTPTFGSGGTVEAFDKTGGSIFRMEFDGIADTVRLVKSGRLHAPVGVTRVMTSFAAREYDGLFLAMWLLGHKPLKPHRSRTYKTAILLRQGSEPIGKTVWHRYPFSGNLACGLSSLLLDVYGLESAVQLDVR